MVLSCTGFKGLAFRSLVVRQLKCSPDNQSNFVRFRRQEGLAEAEPLCLIAGPLD